MAFHPRLYSLMRAGRSGEEQQRGRVCRRGLLGLDPKASTLDALKAVGFGEGFGVGFLVTAIVAGLIVASVTRWVWVHFHKMKRFIISNSRHDLIRLR